ncbi:MULTISPECIES: helicase [unclassified Streptomyces]
MYGSGWVSHQKTRRDKLNGEQLAQLAELGLDWAGEAG